MTKTMIGGVAAAALAFGLTLAAPAGAADSKRADGLTNQTAQTTDVSAQRRRVVRRYYRHPRYGYRYGYRPYYGGYYGYSPYGYYRPYYGPRWYGPRFSFGFGW